MVRLAENNPDANALAMNRRTTRKGTHNRTSKEVEKCVLETREWLRKSSTLGEFGALAIHRQMEEWECPCLPGSQADEGAEHGVVFAGSPECNRRYGLCGFHRKPPFGRTQPTGSHPEHRFGSRPSGGSVSHDGDVRNSCDGKPLESLDDARFSALRPVRQRLRFRGGTQAGVRSNF